VGSGEVVWLKFGVRLWNIVCSIILRCGRDAAGRGDALCGVLRVARPGSGSCVRVCGAALRSGGVEECKGWE